MIKSVYLMTNRNCMFFDEKGEQIADLQATIGWKPQPDYRGHEVHGTLRQMMKDKPEIFISRWQDWSHPITMDEFASLIGFGPWYWEEKQKAEVEESETFEGEL